MSAGFDEREPPHLPASSIGPARYHVAKRATPSRSGRVYACPNSAMSSGVGA